MESNADTAAAAAIAFRALWDKGETHRGMSVAPIWGTTEVLTLMIYHPTTHHRPCMKTRVTLLPSSSKGSLLNFLTGPTRILESALMGTSNPTLCFPLGGQRPTHYLNPTSWECLKPTQCSQCFCPWEGHPRQRKERKNSISSKRD